jgi:hypothetical protein
VEFQVVCFCRLSQEQSQRQRGAVVFVAVFLATVYYLVVDVGDPHVEPRDVGGDLVLVDNMRDIHHVILEFADHTEAVGRFDVRELLAESRGHSLALLFIFLTRVLVKGVHKHTFFKTFTQPTKH